MENGKIFLKAFKTKSHRYSKVHLIESGSSVSLCGRKQIEATKTAVKIIDGKWYKEGYEFNSSISDYDIKTTFCQYCKATAICREADERILNEN